jgi:hypothetical protein
MLLRLIAAAVLLLSVTSGCAGSDLTGPTMTFGSSGSSRRMAPLPAALTHHQAFDPTIAGGPGRPRSAVYSTLKTDDDSAAGLPSPGASNTTATRVLLDLTAHPHARCLDGSPAVMYIRPGWGSGAGVWNLFQEGGGSCHSLGDCAHRSTTNQGSSSPWPASIDLVGKYGAGGLYFSPNAERNPLLWNANVAYLVYCDGGGFSGDNRSTTVVRGGKGALHFRGQEIVRAAIATLAATARLGSAKSVVISGCSEGGVATFAHLDWMAALVKGVAPGVAKIAGLADSGYYPGDGSPHSHVPKQQVRKRVFCAPFYTKNVSFYQGRLGTNIGKTQKEMRFLIVSLRGPKRKRVPQPSLSCSQPASTVGLLGGRGQPPLHSDPSVRAAVDLRHQPTLDRWLQGRFLRDPVHALA